MTSQSPNKSFNALDSDKVIRQLLAALAALGTDISALQQQMALNAAAQPDSTGDVQSTTTMSRLDNIYAALASMGIDENDAPPNPALSGTAATASTTIAPPPGPTGVAGASTVLGTAPQASTPTAPTVPD